MNSDYIAVIDSGIGGLSVLKELIKEMPNEKYIYFGDNENAPYGNRTKMDLLFLSLRNIDFISAFGVKALVLGCNTISTTILNNVKEYCGALPVFGIFPPVEKCLMMPERTLVLATERTAKNYKSTENVHIVGLKNLAKDVENNVYNLENFNAIKSIMDNHTGYFVNEKSYYQNIILGCTHYNFVVKQIFNHFQPQKIIGGEQATALTVKEYFNNLKTIVNSKGFEILFVGKSAKSNKEIYEKSGQIALMK